MSQIFFFLKTFAQICTKFVQISYQFRANFTERSKVTHIHPREIGTQFVQISYEFRTNFT